jgi:hypothetical protein
MKYWLYLVSKLAAGAILMYGLWTGIVFVMPEPEILTTRRKSWFAQDLWWTTAALVFSLISIGVLKIILWDQLYRCRTCARRLRMPLETGSWTSMLLGGKPRTEYICPYGHGTLKMPEVQISGHESPDWEPNDEDIWKELSNYEETRK